MTATVTPPSASRRVGVSKHAGVVLAVATLLGVFAVSAMIVNRTIAVFSDTTQSTANSFSTGTVTLVDDDLSAAMFNVSNMVPGDTATDCIVVTYQGTVADPSAVRLYSGGYTDSGDLATYLNLTIEEGTGGSFGNCTGFTLENTDWYLSLHPA